MTNGYDDKKTPERKTRKMNAEKNTINIKEKNCFAQKGLNKHEYIFQDNVFFFGFHTTLYLFMLMAIFVAKK